MIDFNNRHLFTPFTHPESGVTVHILTRKVAPVQKGFYFVNDSMSADGRFLWFCCACPPSLKKTLGQIIGASRSGKQNIIRTLSLLGKQLQSQEAAFLESGGVRERMTAARLAARDAAVPECLECGKPMRKRQSRKGEFWGCSAYPDCRGSRDIGDAAIRDSRPVTRSDRKPLVASRKSQVALNRRRCDAPARQHFRYALRVTR